MQYMYRKLLNCFIFFVIHLEPLSTGKDSCQDRYDVITVVYMNVLITNIVQRSKGKIQNKSKANTNLYKDQRQDKEPRRIEQPLLTGNTRRVFFVVIGKTIFKRFPIANGYNVKAELLYQQTTISSMKSRKILKVQAF